MKSIPRLALITFMLGLLMATSAVLAGNKMLFMKKSVEPVKEITVGSHISEARWLYLYCVRPGVDTIVVNYIDNKQEGPYGGSHFISPEDAAVYKNHGAKVNHSDCVMGKIDKGAQLRYSLVSDAGNTIDIYVSKIFGCDARFISTNHTTPIAIIVNKDGYIINILDNVRSEKDVFRVLGIS